MRTCIILFFFLHLTAYSLAQTYSVESVPNNKLVTGSYVSNPDGIITQETVARIDSMLTSLENASTAQVAVVVLNSIGDYDVFGFSQELFDLWKIGQAANDNGLLVLFVLDQRTVRFHTGYGIEGILPDAVCKKIQQDHMVPYFREGNYDAGMLAGVAEAARILSDPESAAVAAQSLNAEEEAPLYGLTAWIIIVWIVIVLIVFIVRSKKNLFADPANPADRPRPSFTIGTWLFWYLFLAVGLMIALTLTDNTSAFLGGMYAYTGASLFMRRRLMDREAARWALKKEYHTIYNFYQKEQGLFSAMRFLFPIPFAFLYGGYKRRMRFFREHPRNCRQCGNPLLKLDESADDAFLSKSQLMEEALQSVDYDVWRCSACNAADKLTYINPSSKYSACPKCKTVSYYRVSKSVISAATEHSEGVGEEIHQCKFCGERNVRRYSIPKVTRSSSSSGGSSGGSWGGGSSGGGGASSSW